MTEPCSYTVMGLCGFDSFYQRASGGGGVPCTTCAGRCCCSSTILKCEPAIAPYYSLCSPGHTSGASFSKPMPQTNAVRPRATSKQNHRSKCMHAADDQHALVAMQLAPSYSPTQSSGRHNHQLSLKPKPQLRAAAKPSAYPGPPALPKT
jgi:hypothetical protein